MFWKIVDFLVDKLDKGLSWCYEAPTAKQRARRLPIALLLGIAQARLGLLFSIMIAVCTFVLEKEDFDELMVDLDPLISDVNELRKKANGI